VDFNAPPNVPEEGDFFHPYRALASAQAGVAFGGTIRILAGVTNEKPVLSKPMLLIAPFGSVQVGVR
jgi:hypothetical protein